MGIDTSNNPADFERQYTLALLAAEYGDFSGLEALGITPSAQNLANFSRTASGSTGRSSSGGGSSGGSSGGGSGSTGGSTGTSAASAAMQRANANQGRVTSEADWNTLVAAYGEDTLRAAGYTYAGSGGGSSGGDSGSSGGDNGYSLSDLNTNSVLQLGIGPISYQTVEQLVEQGKVEAYTDSNGNLSVRWMPGYNANNYRNDRSTAGGLTLAPFLPTP